MQYTQIEKVICSLRRNTGFSLGKGLAGTHAEDEKADHAANQGSVENHAAKQGRVENHAAKQRSMGNHAAKQGSVENHAAKHGSVENHTASKNTVKECALNVQLWIPEKLDDICKDMATLPVH